MNNEKYISTLFETNFASVSFKNIYLYGLSLSTKYIIDNCSGFNICGLLDGVKTFGSLYGINIYDINELPSKKADLIIIVARKGTTKVISRRISKFCKDNNIDLYDIYGNDILKETKPLFVNNSYFDLNEQSLRDEIDRHEVISFDIFDTLLMRKLLFPRDVFEIVARECVGIPFDFVSERLLAEHELMINGYPAITDIYSRLSEKNGGYNISYLYKTELDVEREVIIARKKIVEIYNYAIQNSKEVYLVSDMYFPKDILNSFLTYNGILGYNDIIVSCDYGLSKENGLFKILRDRIENKSCLHIGDNEEADSKYPKPFGIDSFLIKSAYDMTEISLYRDILDVVSFNSKLTVGLFISKIFNDPFALYHSEGRCHINTAVELGNFIAPVISDFVLWMTNKASEDGCSDILLASRDGFLVKKMLDAVHYTDIGYHYFLTSRVAAVVSELLTADDIMQSADLPYTGTPEEMMKNRYAINDDDIKKYDDSFADIRTYIEAHMDIILESSRHKHDNYRKYIESLDINWRNRIGFFDFVSSGTTQLGLKKTIATDLYGYYVVNILDDNLQKKALNICAMLGKGLAYEIKTNVYDKYVLLESILSSDMPSLKYFDDQGCPVYGEEYRTSAEINKIISIQDSIVEFFTEYYELCNKTDRQPNDVADIILGFVSDKYASVSASLFSDTLWKDDFNGTVFERNSMIPQ